MGKQPIKKWFSQHDRFFEEPMRALVEGYTIDEVRDYYAQVYVGKYAEEFFKQDLQRVAERAFYGG